MYPFGHVGIALGLGYVLQYGWLQFSPRQRSVASSASAPATETRREAGAGSRVMITARPLQLDFRLLALGVLLPDLIDKVVGPASFYTTRMVGHTLAWALALAILGTLLLRGRARIGLLTVAAASAIHLLQDQMWRQNEVLLWPLYGWRFPATGVRTAAERLQDLARPEIYVPEIVGALILLAAAVRLSRQRAWRGFARGGRLP